MAAEVDYLTKRLREPNIPYTELTNEQIRNIKKDPSSFFSSPTKSGPSVHGPGREGGRFYRDRYTDCIDTPALSQPWGIIDEKYDRNKTGPKTTSQIDAHFRWGTNHAGERTMRHFQNEKVNDYLTIDCYRRPPTNLPGQIIFKYGRPAGGYYEQRDPRGKLEPSPQVTTGILKTQAEYDLERSIQKEQASTRLGQWPEYTEYTDKYELNSATEK